MKSTGISSNQLDYLEHALDLAARRQQLISGNIANANTPGFRTKDLDFASALKAALGQPGGMAPARTHARHIGLTPRDVFSREPEVVEPEGLSERTDKNNVNSDREMANLAENSLQYSLATQLIGREFNLLRTAIKEGRL